MVGSRKQVLQETQGEVDSMGKSIQLVVLELMGQDPGSAKKIRARVIQRKKSEFKLVINVAVRWARRDQTESP